MRSEKISRKIMSAGTALLLLAGCASTTFKPWKMEEIQVGMPKEQVTEILGTPDYTINKDGAEFYYYTYQPDVAPMPDGALDNDAVMERRVEEVSNAMDGEKYEIKIVDGKVADSKKL